MQCLLLIMADSPALSYIFQDEYSSLTFLESYLECKRCGKAVLHNKISIETHTEVIIIHNFILNFICTIPSTFLSHRIKSVKRGRQK